jgi:K+-sensing histidine kinase KdpD
MILNVPEVQNGILGIPEAYSRVVFEPFFRICRTVQEEYKTLDFGLGLTLVEKVINKHNGKVAVENLKNYLDNKGSLVSFKIILNMDKNAI